jgi:hypothetical protein
VGPRAGLDNVEKRTFLTLPGLEIRPLSHPARTDYAMPAPTTLVPISTNIHGVTSQKRLILILTAMRTSNLIYFILFPPHE